MSIYINAFGTGPRGPATAGADTTFNFGYGFCLQSSIQDGETEQKVSVGLVGPLVELHKGEPLEFRGFDPEMAINAVLGDSALGDLSRRVPGLNQKDIGTHSLKESDKSCESQAQPLPLSKPLLHFMHQYESVWQSFATGEYPRMGFGIGPGHLILVCGVTKLSATEYNSLVAASNTNGTVTSPPVHRTRVFPVSKARKEPYSIAYSSSNLANSNAGCDKDDRATLMDGEHNEDKDFDTASMSTYASSDTEASPYVAGKDLATDQSDSGVTQPEAEAGPAHPHYFIHYYKLRTFPYWHKFLPYDQLCDYFAHLPVWPEPNVKVEVSVKRFDPVDVLLDFITKKALCDPKIWGVKAAVASDLHLYALFNDHHMSKIPMRERKELKKAIRKLNPEICWVDKTSGIIGLKYALNEL